ncbi:MAG: HpcH/HpaI aldolase family protein [Ardenticatenaceae bacterium]
MRENKIRTIWEEGGAALNGWLHIPSSWSAEVMAHQGWDSLTIDMQHGMAGFQVGLTMLQAISTTETVPLARVPWNEPAMIMRMLDAGAYGIICPMVNTRAEAEKFVGACRYHPQGYRSLGPTRASVYAGAGYAQHANETIITMAMIETEEALNNVEEIVSVPGLDAIYVGPGDLSLTLSGKGGVDLTDPLFLEALDKIVAACQKHGVVAGIHTNSPAYALQMIEKGFQFITVMTDTRLLARAAREMITGVKGEHAKAEMPQAGPY